MFEPKRTWVDVLSDRLFPKKSWEEKHMSDRMLVLKTATEAQASMNEAAYRLHMALAEIEAMEDWTHGRNIRKEFPR